MSHSLGVLVPCLNEEAAIGELVAHFRRALPGATLYGYGNASCDQTAGVAHAAGAVVRVEPLRGKGNVVRRMFSGVEADVYVLVKSFLALAALSVGLALPVVETFHRTGMVPRLPTAVLSMGTMLLAFRALACGLVLDTVTRGRRELERLSYLRTPALRSDAMSLQRQDRARSLAS